MTTELLIVGGGRMGSALLGGLIGSGVLQEADCAVAESDPVARDALLHRFPTARISENAVPSDSAVLAVKPADVESGCRTLKSAGASRVISILAGTTIGQLEQLLANGTAVIRAMPNTPALLGAGATAIAAGTKATERDLAWAEKVLGAVSLVARLPESLLDAATGLSGSGPAYVFLVAEALIEAGEAQGLDHATSSELALQTIFGSARMLIESGLAPDVLRAQVTSPNGTTAAGLRVLETLGLRAAFHDAVQAATERSRELGEGR